MEIKKHHSAMPLGQPWAQQQERSDLSETACASEESRTASGREVPNPPPKHGQYREILFSLQKEGDPVICNNMDELKDLRLVK